MGWQRIIEVPLWGQVGLHWSGGTSRRNLMVGMGGYAGLMKGQRVVSLGLLQSLEIVS